MLNGDLISVIVPVYNVSQYLSRCIKSIMVQNYSKLQIILINDGSTDNSGEICDKYAMEDRRITVIHKQNGGVVSARKTGLSAASGQYIGFVDGDDYIEPNMFQMLHKRMIAEGVDFVHSGYVKNNDVCVQGVKSEGIHFIEEESITNILKQLVFDSTDKYGISPSIWSKLFKRDLVINAHNEVPDSLSYGEDLLFLCICIMKSRKILLISQAYYHYVIRNDSICHEQSIISVTRVFELYQCLCYLFQTYNRYSAIKEHIEKYFLRVLSCNLNRRKKLSVQIYKYPQMNELINKKIALYGAGEVGEDYYTWISRYHLCHVVAWADSNYQNMRFDYCEIIGIEELITIEFDILVIGVLFEETSIMIRDSLLSMGIDNDKIIWRKPEFIL